MARLLHDYQRRARAMAEARRLARRTHPIGCECLFCITPQRALARIAAKAAEQRPVQTEAPF